MSFGALSYEAKTALARGATMAGTATCSGEGGMIPDERRYSTKWLYQNIQSRYGFNPHHLMLADACEFFIGQGCKVGLGGHLMGQKVTDQVAEMRSLPAGIDQRSPARHPDWLGPDDLALKILEIREATDWQIPIQLKLGAARVYDDVRMAVEMRPRLHLHRRDGRQHRRRPPSRHRGDGGARHGGHPPWRAESRRRSRQAGRDSRSSTPAVSATGGDVAKALALGADAISIGHSVLMALNCNQGHPGGRLRGGDGGRGRGTATTATPAGVRSESRTQDPDPAQAARPGRGGRMGLQLPAHADHRGPDDGPRVRERPTCTASSPRTWPRLTMEASAMAGVAARGVRTTPSCIEDYHHL